MPYQPAPGFDPLTDPSETALVDSVLTLLRAYPASSELDAWRTFERAWATRTEFQDRGGNWRPTFLDDMVDIVRQFPGMSASEGRKAFESACKKKFAIDGNRGWRLGGAPAAAVSPAGAIGDGRPRGAVGDGRLVSHTTNAVIGIGKLPVADTNNSTHEDMENKDIGEERLSNAESDASQTKGRETNDGIPKETVKLVTSLQINAGDGDVPQHNKSNDAPGPVPPANRTWATVAALNIEKLEEAKRAEETKIPGAKTAEHEISGSDGPAATPAKKKLVLKSVLPKVSGHKELEPNKANWWDDG